jgi:hypothetical protein
MTGVDTNNGKQDAIRKLLRPIGVAVKLREQS